MRMIGHVQNEANARLFGDYLYVKGIGNQIESEKDGTWVIWVEGEDDVDRARGFLRTYLTRPDDPEYRRAAKQARDLREQQKEQDEAAAKRFFDGSELFRKHGPYGLGPLTIGLTAVCVLIWVAREFGGNIDLWNFLFISEYDSGGLAERLRHGLPEVRHGQVWRLFTPILMHAPLMPFPGFLHILFNMIWLKDLGSMVEARQSSLQLAWLVLVISASSNVAQFLVSGPYFYGMSGIVYGLLGYAWMKARFDPASGYFLHPTTVAIMLIWFVFCLTGVMNAANTVHAVGLGMGVAWGYLGSIRRSSKHR
ncbi:MAG: rhomboid family intramembrane serine protease [Verrucomicrobia bacterium]|nr:rhomboid family intramembrane serine protease [Verrucomicrobiota bacterium]